MSLSVSSNALVKVTLLQKLKNAWFIKIHLKKKFRWIQYKREMFKKKKFAHNCPLWRQQIGRTLLKHERTKDVGGREIGFINYCEIWQSAWVITHKSLDRGINLKFHQVMNYSCFMDCFKFAPQEIKLTHPFCFYFSNLIKLACA